MKVFQVVLFQQSFEAHNFCLIEKMERSEFHVVVKYKTLRKKTPAEIKPKLDKHFPGSPPSIRMIYKWYVDFRCGRKSTDGAKRSGRSKERLIPKILLKKFMLL